MHTRVVEAHPGFVKAHPAVKAHLCNHGVVDDHHGGEEVLQGALETHKKILKAIREVVEAYRRAPVSPLSFLFIEQ
jgi:hypothetical protein